ncbi:cytochrome c [Hydrogenophaga laconesensis]|uniref:Mono/diheme cytochrome c family protein n=1 Tax=Hydrogenophaga laconesensis TaxID=1805971 RepID=A0ABU1V4X7_9BURK|nr:cytochrome c [Hydrogenophaga laconesensis]MDR7092437.1 mono/diheme cytochrome c family protein [Hydrogenophaga laconesensis]
MRAAHLRSTGRKALLVLGGVLLAGAAVMAWLVWPAQPLVVRPADVASNPADPHTIERGRYLAVLGNCQACHTTRGGTPFAGGLGVVTPFGTVYGSNLTPSENGLGDWSADDFWRALHHGQGRDGRWLNPAFPYSNTTRLSREDSDALFAFFLSLPPVDTPVPAHDMRWPYNTQFALKAWRTLYFRAQDAAPPAAATTSTATLERGAYLVNGLGHCSACHVPRDALGGQGNLLGLSGGLIPMQRWYAPSLLDPAEAGLQHWSVDEIVALFRDGRARDALVSGPMAEVVQHSTQHWAPQDLQAMAIYLRQLPSETVTQRLRHEPADSRVLAAGGQRYEQHCAQCHGARGEGVSSQGAVAYPPLAGNRTVTMASPANLAQIVLNGGFGPSTQAHPRPFGMPPFVLQFNDQELAELLTYVRTQWGNQAPPVSALDVQQLRRPLGH